jgi:hypothetical protein
MKISATFNRTIIRTIKRPFVRLLILLVFCNAVSSPLIAEASFEGWEQISTAHFQIIFEPQDYAHAQEVASYADEVYLQLSKLLDHSPKEKIPVVITGRTAMANGYFSPIPARIILFTTSPSTRFMGSRTPDWLRSVFVHELTHYIHLTSPVGPASFLTPIFGPAIPAMNTPFMPGWWIEGITTYTESTYSIGGRGDAPFFELAYKAPLIEDEMWSLSQSSYQSAFPPSGRIYVGGYIFVEYLMNRFGEDIYARINQTFANLPFLGLNRAIRLETGFDARDLYNDMLDQRKTAFKEHLPSVQSKLFSPDDLGDFHLPFITERGVIGWARTYGKGGAIVLYPQEGGQPKILKPVYPIDAQSFDVTHDGQTAVVAISYDTTSHPASIPSASVSYSDIVLIDLVAGVEHWLTHGERLLHPAIHPDGKAVVATQVIGTRYRLVNINLETGLLEVLYENPSGSLYEPRFSPDGQRILVVEVVQGRSALLLLESDKPVRYLEAPGPGGIYRPRFIDNASITFGSDREGTLAVYRHEIENDLTTKVLEDPIGAFGAQVTNGTVIYATYSSKGYALKQIPLETLRTIPTATQESTPEPTRPISLGLSSYQSKPYVDIPRFNLWLPLPAIDSGIVAPGVWVMLSSVLNRHQIVASGAWDIDYSLLLGSLDYTFFPSWGALSLNGMLNLVDGGDPELPRQHWVSALVATPLWSKRHLASIQGMDFATQLQFRFRNSGDSLISSSQIMYSIAGQGAARSFFGNQYLGIVGGLHVQTQVPISGNLVLQPFIGLAAQMPVFQTNQVVRLEVEALADSSGLLPETALLPRGNPSWNQQQGEVKMRGTLLYRIPLGLFDQSIPFGGILGAGATVFAQSAAYLSSGNLAWEQDGYVGLEMHADVVLGALFNFRPMAGMVFRLSDGAYHIYINLNISSLLINPIAIPATL